MTHAHAPMGRPPSHSPKQPASQRHMAAAGPGGGGKGLSRHVLSISSWFRIPAQGMKKHEPLSRGTAFCLQLPPQSSGDPRRVIVTCSHVVAPYRWRQHFKEPWLEFVQDAHVECRLQSWEGRGGAGHRGSLSRERRVRAPLHFHPSLDLCAFAYAPDEAAAEEEGGEMVEPLATRDVAGEGSLLEEGEPLHFLGFPIQATPDSAAASSLSSLAVEGFHHVQGRALPPHIVDREGRRYARTERRLAVGMSGGPVLDREGRCVGLFQGILPPPPPSSSGPPETDDGEASEKVDPILVPFQREAWQLHAAFVPMAPILAFVQGLLVAKPSSKAK